ncbi:gamma-glutamylcyclotransferase [Vibrio sp.]|nr:gamma-glutamylcyclotransferase [Vibrio sp.]
MGTIFVYGSLMNEEVFTQIVNGHFRKEKGTLAGYKRVKIKGHSFPAIYPVKDRNFKSSDVEDSSIQEGSSVDGIVIYDVDQSSLGALDDFEADFYDRTAVDVDTVSGTVSCYAYVFDLVHQDILSDQEWDNDSFRRDHLSDFLLRCFGVTVNQ